jgi:hypothetical protein
MRLIILPRISARQACFESRAHEVGTIGSIRYPLARLD